MVRGLDSNDSHLHVKARLLRGLAGCPGDGVTPAKHRASNPKLPGRTDVEAPGV